MSKVQNSNLEGWHRNTDLSVNLKTILRSDRKMKPCKDYQGVLRLDAEGTVEEFLSRDAHYTFVETLPWTTKRNPRLFNGKYISITRRPDGSLRPNFRPMKVGADFSVEKYAVGVANELLWGLESLIENESVEEKSE
jgi:hypothetical protein